MELDELVGSWVAVHYSFTTSGVYTGGFGMHSVYGVLESADDAALLVRQGDGETLYLPLATIKGIQAIEPPEIGPGGTHLRAAEPDTGENELVRPAAGSDSNLLLRPDETATQDDGSF